MGKNPRDHGYGKSPEVVGAPDIIDRVDLKCPHCGCTPTWQIEVVLKEAPSTLRRPPSPHKIIGSYIGCAACPWAGPMLAVARPTS